MGCCQSSTVSETALNTQPNSSAAHHQSIVKKGKEDKIELAFKAKRANIFTHGVDLERQAFTIRRNPKSENHAKLICKHTLLKIYSSLNLFTPLC